MNQMKIDHANIELMEENILDLVAAMPSSNNLELAKKLLATYRKAIECKARGGIPVGKMVVK